MENDRRKIELLNALLLSMPGTPVLYYGDEIGMGDNVFLGDRDGVRTPMQWSFDRNGGFSRADPARLYLPPIMDPVYGFEAVNVEAQSRSPSSLLNWIKRLIAARRSRRAFGRGTPAVPLSVEPQGHRLSARYGDETILCVANLSRSAQAVELDLVRVSRPAAHRGAGAQRLSADRRAALPADPAGHSFFWFELLPTAAEAGESVEAAPPEFVTLVMPHGWADLFRQHNLPQLERDVIPAFLPRQRWFGAKDQQDRGGLGAGAWRDRAAAPRTGRRPRSFLAGVVEAQLAGGERQRYFLPLAAVWSSAETELRQSSAPGDTGRVAPVPPRRRAGRRAVAGRLCTGADGGDPAASATHARSKAQARSAVPQDAAVRQVALPERLVARRSWGGAVEQLGALRRLRRC